MNTKLEFPGSNVPSDGDTPTIAAIYARTSSVNQRFGYSLNEQVRQCQERCEVLGWDLKYVFRDEAESGKDTDRPAFQRLRDRVRLGPLDVVVFWKLDRFSRSILHAVQIEREFREYDVGLHSVTEQLDTTNATGRFNFRNIANAAEFERDMIKQRTRMGLKALALERRWPNDHPPIGYDKDDDGRLVVNEEERELVVDIFESYVEQASMPAVSDDLNVHGIRTKTGNEWTPRAIRDVLTNRIYLGEYSVAGVEDRLPELRVIEDVTFERAKEVRQRFRKESSSQDRTSADRKSKTVDGMVRQYSEYLDRNDSLPVR